MHHLNCGILLLTVTGGYLLFASPHLTAKRRAALVYGVALALTFDEFCMWLHLGGSYWQRCGGRDRVVLHPRREHVLPDRRAHLQVGVENRPVKPAVRDIRVGDEHMGVVEVGPGRVGVRDAQRDEPHLPKRLHLLRVVASVSVVARVSDLGDKISTP